MASLNDIVKLIVNTLRADGKMVTKAVAHIVAETIYNPETGKFYAEGPIDERSAQIVVAKAIEALKSSGDNTFMTLLMQISKLTLLRVRNYLHTTRKSANRAAQRSH